MRTNFILLLLSFVCQTHAQVSFGKSELLNDDWLFLRADSAWNIFETPDMKEVGYDDSRWRHVTLPHDWGVELPMSPDKGSCQGYLPGGTGWYRKSLPQPLLRSGEASSPPPLRLEMGERVFVYFEGIYSHSEVYLNGHLLGMRPSGFASFLYDMTPYLRADGENVLAVRVNHSQENDSRWYTGSGINRNVWLITAPEVHLAQWGTAYRVLGMDDRYATLEVDVETSDDRLRTSDFIELEATVELADADGKVAASVTCSIGTQEKRTVCLTVEKPRRWTLEKPCLYTLTTRLMAREYSSLHTPHATLLDQSVVKAGLRTLEFSPDKGFALNGRWMKVKGVCVHDDAGVLGTAVPAEVWRRRIQELKAIGVNAIRMQI